MSGSGEVGANPVRAFLMENFDAAVHVLCFIEDHVAFRALDGLKESARCVQGGGLSAGIGGMGVEEESEVAVAVEKFVYVFGEDGAAEVCVAVDFPIGLEADEEIAIKDLHVRIFGAVDFDPVVANPNAQVGGEKSNAAFDEFVQMAVVVIGIGIDSDIVGFAFEDGLGGGERGISFPLFDDAGIAGGGHGGGAEIGSDVEGVGIAPGDGDFRFGHVEAVGDEVFFEHVEFADDFGIGSAAGEFDEAFVACGLKDDDAFPGPVFFFFDRECVEIEDGFPGGRGFFEFVHRGAAPDSADVVVVLPEVVEVGAVFGDARG